MNSSLAGTIPNSTLDDEAHLLERIAEGDAVAFTRLFDKYQNKVFSHALAFLKSAPEAEEAVTDIFMKVWLQRSKLSKIENFRSYLFILGKNHLISATRKRLIQQTTVNDEDAWVEDIMQPDVQYGIKELKQIIMEGVERLTPQQKKVFTLSRFEGLTYREIADHLSVSNRTVKFHMILALNFLREYVRNFQILYLLLPTAFLLQNNFDKLPVLSLL